MSIDVILSIVATVASVVLCAIIGVLVFLVVAMGVALCQYRAREGW